MNPRNVLFLNHGSVTGGSEIEFGRLLRHFGQLPGYNVYGAYPEGRLAEEWDRLCLARCEYRGRLPRLPRARTYVGQLVYGARFLPGLARFIKQHRIDLVVVNSSVPLGALVLLRALRTPTIVVVREFVFPGWLCTLLFRLIDRAARRVVVVSDALKVDFVGRTGSRKVSRVFGGIDLERFTFQPVRPTVATIGAIGSINPLKGQIDLARAAAEPELRRRTSGVRYLLIGPSPGALAGYRGQIEAVLRESGLTESFTFAGEIFDMPPVYNRLDVVVVASRSEGQSLVVPEAWASGCPVIATRSGGPADMIEDGVNGLLVPPADPPAMARALVRLIDDFSLRQRLAEAGRAQAEARFAATSSDRQIQSIVEEVLEAEARRRRAP